jgi:hypothetical protein
VMEQECEAAPCAAFVHVREPVGVKADSFRTAPASIVSTVATVGSAGTNAIIREAENERRTCRRGGRSPIPTRSPHSE